MSLGRHTAYNVIGQAAPVVVSLATVPAYLHVVGVERYGVLAIAWMLLGYFGVFDLGLTRALMQRIAFLHDEEPAMRARAFWTGVCLAAALAVIGAVAMYFAGHWYIGGPLAISPALRIEALAALPLLSLVLPLGILWGLLNGALLGRERFLEFNIVSTVTSMLAQITPILVAWIAGPRLSFLLAASLAIQSVALIVSLALCFRYVTEGSRGVPSRGEAMALLRYGGWISLSAITAPLMSLTDRFAIGSLVNAAAVAVYAVPAQLAQRASIIPSSMASALLPKLSAERDRATAIATALHSRLVVTAVMTPLVLAGIVGMRPFLAIWLNGRLGDEAVIVGQVLLAGWWFNAVAATPVALLQADGRPRSVAMLHLAELPVYAGLLWWLTLAQGATGAAMAFTLRCVLDAVGLNLLAFGWRQKRAAPILPAALLIGLAVIVAPRLQLDAIGVGSAAAILLAGCLIAMVMLPGHLRQRWLGIVLDRLRLGRRMRADDVAR